MASAKTLAAASAYHLEILEGDAKAPRTIRKYGMEERRFIEFLSERLGRAPTLADLTASNVRAFQAWLRTVHRSPRKGGATVGHSATSIAQYVATLKIWSAFLVRHKLLRKDPLADVSVPKVPQKELNVLSDEQIRLMVDLCARTHAPHRNAAILMLLYDTGLRSEELRTARLEDFHSPTSKERTGRLKVMGKGSKERIVYPGWDVCTEIAKYRKFERGDHPAPWLFIGRGGRQLSGNALNKVIKFVGERAGIVGVRLSCHTLRHSCATEKAQLVSAWRLQTELGHASLRHTARYIHLAQLKTQNPGESLVDRWRRK